MNNTNPIYRKIGTQSDALGVKQVLNERLNIIKNEENIAIFNLLSPTSFNLPKDFSPKPVEHYPKELFEICDLVVFSPSYIAETHGAKYQIIKGTNAQSTEVFGEN